MSAAAGHYRVESTSVREQAVAKLRQAIHAGYLKPGQKLVEKDLCTLLGVSRPSLREALRVLESEKFIVSPHNKGPSVVLLTLEDIDQLFDARSVLGSHVARRAATLATNDDIKSLERALEALSSSIEAEDASGVIASTHAYYDALRIASRNTIVSDLMQKVRDRLSLLRAVAPPDFKRARETLAEVRAVVRAVKRGDPEAAAAATLAHENRAAAAARAVLLKFLQQV